MAIGNRRGVNRHSEAIPSPAIPCGVRGKLPPMSSKYPRSSLIGYCEITGGEVASEVNLGKETDEEMGTMKSWFKRNKGMLVIIGGAALIILVLYWQRGLVKNNEGLVMVIVTTMLIATTMYYSWLNKCLLETTDMPKVVVYIRPYKKYAEQHVLIIENLGTGTAFNIRFHEVDTSFVLQKDPDLYLADIPCIKEGIDYMPPKQDYKTFIDSTKLTDGQRDRSYKIKVDYTNSHRKKFTDRFNLNIGVTLHYFHEYPGVEHLGEIAIHTKQIASHTEKFANQSLNTPSTSSTDPNLQRLSTSDISIIKKAAQILSSLGIE